jgi:hypothetical protein
LLLFISNIPVSIVSGIQKAITPIMDPQSLAVGEGARDLFLSQRLSSVVHPTNFAASEVQGTSWWWWWWCWWWWWWWCGVYMCICVYVYTSIGVYLYVCICVYVCMCLCVYVYMWMYTRKRCRVQGSHSQSNVAATLYSIGKINKGIREY